MRRLPQYLLVRRSHAHVGASSVSPLAQAGATIIRGAVMFGPPVIGYLKWGWPGGIGGLFVGIVAHQVVADLGV